MTPFPGGPRTEMVTFTIAGYAFVGMGYDASGIYHTDLWKYNPYNDSWDQSHSFPHGISHAAAFTIGEHGYVVTGQDEMGAYSNEVWRLTEGVGWFQMTDAPLAPLRGSAFASLKDHAYVIAGLDQTFSRTDEVWEFHHSMDPIKLNIYPNPTVGDFYISHVGFDVPVEFRIYDTSGRRVADIVLSVSDQSTRASTYNLSTGVYIIYAYENDELIATGKLAVISQ